MSTIRVQIELKNVLDEHSPKSMYKFWYGFETSKIRTVEELLHDIQENYLQTQLVSISGKNEILETNSVRIDLDGCQLLPFTPSEILRDNDKLTLIPLSKYKLQRKNLAESLHVAVLPEKSSEDKTVEPRKPIEKIPEKIESVATKTVEVQPMEIEPATQSTITITKTKGQSNHDEQKPKKVKTKINDEPINISSAEKPTKQIVEEKNEQSEVPLSVPTIAGRLKEIKSKTPKWKEEKPARTVDGKKKLHVRFDSESEEENSEIEHVEQETLPTSNEQEKTTENPKNEDSVPKSVPPVESKQNQIQKKKTLDLLLEMKQFKSANEQPNKKVRQQIAKKRSQHRKRALLSLSIGNFLDNAFGLTQSDNETSDTVKSHQAKSAPSTPKSLPTSFNKIARLPLIAQAIETNDKVYDLYPPVERLPSANNRIAFKLLQLSEDFCPKMSDYKEGTILSVNESNNELTIELDQPLETVFDQPSKFFIPAEEQSKEDATTVIMSFAELHSVRLLPARAQNETA